MRQTKMMLPSWGGARKGAGRKPNGARAGVPHLRRERLSGNHPVHVTLRVVPACWNLRSGRGRQALLAAFEGGRDRFGFRLVHYSIQGNHLHLMVEAESRGALSRGMKGLSVRIARALNRMMQRKGRVLADRFHAHVLKTRREAGNALRYLFGNFAHHVAPGNGAPGRYLDPFTSIRYLAACGADAPVRAPRTWLLRVGWHG